MLTWTIAKAKVDEPTADETVFTYNGSAQTYTLATSEHYTISGNVQTNAGNHTVTVTLVDTANYEWSDSTNNALEYSFVINKLAVLEPTVTGSYVYTGYEHTVTINGLESYMTITSGNKATDAGTYTVVITLDNNHEWASDLDGKVEWTIVKAKVDKPTADKTVFTYNESAQTYTLATSEHYTISGNVQTNAGNHTVTVALVDTANYEWTDGTTTNVTFTFTIGKAQAVITVDQTPIEVTYGETWSIPTATTNYGTVTYDKTLSDMKNSGSYVITYSVVETNNFYGTTKTVEVTVLKAQVDKPTADETVFTYNGSAQTYTLATSEHYSISGNVQTDAGNHTVTVALVDTANYEWTDGTTTNVTFTFTIGKAQAVITVDQTPIEVTYGETWSIPTATTNYGTVTYDKTLSDMKNSGSYVITYSVVETNNFYGTTKTVEVTVLKAQVDKPTADETVFTYNGSAQTYTLATSEHYSISGNVQTDAGNHTVTVALVDTANYEWTDGTTTNVTFTFTIAKATNSITLSNTANINTTYGNAITLPTATSKFGTITCNYTASQLVNAGEYTVTWTVTGNNNYDEATVSITVIINKAVITITSWNIEVIITQSTVPTPNITGIVNDDQVYVVVEGTGSIVGTGYEATATGLAGADSANYELAEENLTTEYYIINEKTKVTITVADITITYGDDIPTLTASSNVEGIDLSGLTFTIVDTNGNEPTKYNAGTYSIIVSRMEDTIEYEYTFIDGTLTVEKAELTIIANQLSIVYGSTLRRNATSDDYEVQGLVYGDDVSILSGITGRLIYTYELYQNVGEDYEYYIDFSSVELDNYVILNKKSINAQLTVMPKVLTVEWDTEVEYVYNTLNQTPVVNIDTIYNSDDCYLVFNATQFKYVGIYNLTITGIAGSKSGNYMMPTENLTHTLEIKKATPTITSPTLKDIIEGVDSTIVTNTGSASIQANNSTITVKGTFTFATEEHGAGLEFVPNNTNITVATIKIAFTPQESNNYNMVVIDVPVNIYAVASINYSTYYGTVEKAVENAISGDEVYVQAISKIPSGSNIIISKNININSGISLVLPYEADGRNILTKTSNQGSGVGTLLTIQDDVVINVYGSLSVSAKVGHESSAGAKAVIMNHGVINIYSGAALNSYGYIKGEGYIEAKSGAVVTDLFKIYDWVGGRTAYAYNSKDILPFQCYSIHNISCDMKIYSGATYQSYALLYADGDIMLDKNMILIGNGGLFKLSNGYMIKQAEDTNVITNFNTKYNESNQLITQRDILNIYGDFEDGAVSIEVSLSKYGISIPINVETSTTLAMPIGFFNINIISGTGTLSNNSYKFLPGSSLYIAEDAALVVKNGAKLVFFDEYTDDYDYYTSADDDVADKGLANGFSYQKKHEKIYIEGIVIDEYKSKCIVDGYLNVENGSLAGIITSENSGRILLSSASASMNILTEVRLNGQSLLVTTVSSCEVTSQTYYARGNVNLVENSRFTSGVTYYYSSSFESWMPDSYEYNITYEYIYNECISSGNVVNNNIAKYTASTSFNLMNISDGNLLFVGWYLDEECTQPVRSIYGADYLDDIILYGKFNPEEEKYNISFVTNDSSSLVSIDIGKSLLETWNPNVEYGLTTKDNVETYNLYFDGWYLDSEYEVPYNYSLINADTTLYAKWSNKYVVKFIDGNGNEVTSLRKYIYPDSSFEIPSGVDAKKTSLPKENYNIVYDFKNWVNNSNLFIPNEIYANVNSDLIFTADFNETNMCTITLDITDAKVTINGTVYNGDGTFDIPYGTTIKPTVEYLESKNQSFTIDGKNHTSGDPYTVNKHVTIYAYSKGSSCVVSGTLITLADGTTKKVEELVGNEKLLIWNHMTGKYEQADIAYIVNHNNEMSNYEVIYMIYEDGTKLGIVEEHVFYVYELNKYIAITEDNVEDYLGYTFMKTDPLTGRLVKVKLVDVEYEIVYTGLYEVVTYQNITCFTNGILSASAYLDKLLNIFDINQETMSYSESEIIKDIEQYGLYTYEDFKDLISEEAFELYNAKYLKIAVEKGYITWDDILWMIDIYFDVEVNPLES